MRWVFIVPPERLWLPPGDPSQSTGGRRQRHRLPTRLSGRRAKKDWGRTGRVLVAMGVALVMGEGYWEGTGICGIGIY